MLGSSVQTSSSPLAVGANVTLSPDTQIEYQGDLAVRGALSSLAIANPATPTITNVGTAGAVTYGYKVVATVNGRSTAASSEGTTTTGNATLSTSNYNVVTWTKVTGATGYKIYRTTGGTTPPMLISTITSGDTLSYNDTDKTSGSSSTPPTTNITGLIIARQDLIPTLPTDRLGYILIPNSLQGSANFEGIIGMNNLKTYGDWVSLIRVDENDYVGIGGGCAAGTYINSSGDHQYYPASTGTGKTILYRGTTATNGQANDSPTLRLEAQYDADATAGVTATVRNALLLHDMVTAGASPKSHLDFAIGAVGAEATILELENNNATLTAYLYGGLKCPQATTIETTSGNLSLIAYATLYLACGSGNYMQVQGARYLGSSNASPCGYSVVNTALTIGSAGSIVIPVANMTDAANDAARDTLAGNVDGVIALDSKAATFKIWGRYGGAWKSATLA